MHVCTSVCVCVPACMSCSLPCPILDLLILPLFILLLPTLCATPSFQVGRDRGGGRWTGLRGRRPEGGDDCVPAGLHCARSGAVGRGAGCMHGAGGLHGAHGVHGAGRMRGAGGLHGAHGVHGAGRMHGAGGLHGAPGVHGAPSTASMPCMYACMHADYNHLLTTQLESQRHYFEGLMSLASKEAERAVAAAEAAAGRAAQEAAAAGERARESERRRQAAEAKLVGGEGGRWERLVGRREGSDRSLHAHTHTHTHTLSLSPTQHSLSHAERRVCTGQEARAGGRLPAQPE